jgi:hypothetical protein
MSFENALMSFCDMRTFVVAMPLRIRALPKPKKAKSRKATPKSIPKKLLP